MRLLKSAADKTGLALGAYLRAAALDSPGPRAARKPPIRRQELVRLLGQIGKLGSNVNQIARAINTGDDPYGLVDDMKAASVEIAEMRAAILQALGEDAVIIKGGSRAAPRSLAKHLMRGDTNERVLVLGYDGVAIEDLNAALADMQALASGTRGKKGLYHANIDPHTDYKMTPEQWDRCVAVLEKELGLEGQPRVVVLHEKKGREHIHVVWARTDIDTMTLRSDSNNYLAHERASAPA